MKPLKGTIHSNAPSKISELPDEAQKSPGAGETSLDSERQLNGDSEENQGKDLISVVAEISSVAERQTELLHMGPTSPHTGAIKEGYGRPGGQVDIGTYEPEEQKLEMIGAEGMYDAYVVLFIYVQPWFSIVYLWISLEKVLRRKRKKQEKLDVNDNLSSFPNYY